MIIKEAIAELEFKDSPVAKLLHTGVAFKIVVLAFKKGMILKENKTAVPTKLTVIGGKIMYTDDNTNIVLDKYEEFLVPMNEFHSLEAFEDSLCLLIQGYRN